MPPDEPGQRRIASTGSRGDLRRYGLILLAATIGVAGAWIGMVVWGARTVPVGPFRVQLTSRIGPGNTVVSLPPLGQLTADTHTAPLTVRATLESVNVRALADRLQDEGLTGVATETEHGLRAAIPPFATRVSSLR